MCSIYGAVGSNNSIDPGILASIREAARDRGRDGGRSEWYELGNGRRAVLGNWRAAPTPEIEHPAAFQPYDGVVHNGTIANDRELGRLDGEVDSQVLPRVLDRTGLDGLVKSLARVQGSYALAAVGTDPTGHGTVYLACNYKPLHYWSPDGGRTTYFSSMERHFRQVLPAGQRAVQLTPYSAIDLTAHVRMDIPRRDRRGAVVVASAGLDSTVVAAYLANRENRPVRLLHFRYGCRAQPREEAAIPLIAADLKCTHDFIDLPYLKMAGASPLLDGGRPIAGGEAGAEYAHEWVPARNLVTLALSVAYAEANGYGLVALGNNLEESGAYPDNEEQMTTMLDAACPYFVQNGYRVNVVSPVGNLMKHEIVALGLRVGAPFRHTWSCYRSGETHCGECGPCFMRREAFRRNGAADPAFAGSGGSNRGEMSHVTA